MRTRAFCGPTTGVRTTRVPATTTGSGRANAGARGRDVVSTMSLAGSAGGTGDLSGRWGGTSFLVAAAATELLGFAGTPTRSAWGARARKKCAPRAPTPTTPAHTAPTTKLDATRLRMRWRRAKPATSASRRVSLGR